MNTFAAPRSFSRILSPGLHLTGWGVCVMSGGAGDGRHGAQQPPPEDPVPPEAEAGAGGDAARVHAAAARALPPGAVRQVPLTCVRACVHACVRACVCVCVCAHLPPVQHAYHHRGLDQLILAPCGSAWQYSRTCSHLGGPIHGTPRSPVRSLSALGLLRITHATTCMVHTSSQQPGAAVSLPFGETGRSANRWIAGPIRHLP